MVISTYSSFPLSKCRQLISATSWKFHGKTIMGTLGIEPGAAGWEAQTLPLCYASSQLCIFLGFNCQAFLWRMCLNAASQSRSFQKAALLAFSRSLLFLFGSPISFSGELALALLLSRSLVFAPPVAFESFDPILESDFSNWRSRSKDRPIKR